MKGNYYKKTIALLNELHHSYPTYPMGRHIATAFADYGDIWGLPDREFFSALNKYASELALDIQSVASDDYVYKIQKDAQTLFDPAEEEDEF